MSTQQTSFNKRGQTTIISIVFQYILVIVAESFQDVDGCKMEAGPGIEPRYTALQAGA